MAADRGVVKKDPTLDIHRSRPAWCIQDHSAVEAYSIEALREVTTTNTTTFEMDIVRCPGWVV